jgi:hypothetical protein
MTDRRKETIFGLIAITATITAAAILGPYVRTPTGGGQLDQNKTGSTTVIEHIIDRCGAFMDLTAPSFRMWIPKAEMGQVDHVTVTTGKAVTDIPFRNESCGSLTTLALIGSSMTCVRECTDKSCLVATTPDSEDHFGTSIVSFRSTSGKEIASETFNVSKSAETIPGSEVSVDGRTLVVRTSGPAARLRGTAYFPATLQEPRSLIFSGGTSRIDIPDSARSYRVFLQRSFSAVEGLDLHGGPASGFCGR